MLKKILAKSAYQLAKKNANEVCPFFFYQKQLPEKVKKLKK